MNILPFRVGANRGRGAQSIASFIQEDLRKRILSVELKPGQALPEADLVEAYDVSRTPVREALLLLAHEGLVTIVPQSGTYVSRISRQMLPQAVKARQALEELAGREAAKLRPSGLVFARSLAQMKAATAHGDHSSFHDADDDFHAAILLAANMPMLLPIVRQIKAHIHRFRLLTVPLAGRMEFAIAEHEGIAAAILGGDPEGAASAIGSHISRLIDTIGEIEEAHLDYFEP